MYTEVASETSLMLLRGFARSGLKWFKHLYFSVTLLEQREGKKGKWKTNNIFKTPFSEHIDSVKIGNSFAVSPLNPM